MQDKLTKLAGKERLGQNRTSEYLGAEDIEDGFEPVLTIDAIWNGIVTTQKGKENKDVLTFVEKSVPGLKLVRPLIVNATNRKTLKKTHKDVTAETLHLKRIQLYVDHDVRDPTDGTKTDGIRIRQRIPAPPVRIICEDCKKDITAANNMDPATLSAYTKQKYGKSLCAACATKIAATVSKPIETEQADEAKPE